MCWSRQSHATEMQYQLLLRLHTEQPGRWIQMYITDPELLVMVIVKAATQSAPGCSAWHSLMGSCRSSRFLRFIGLSNRQLADCHGHELASCPCGTHVYLLSGLKLHVIQSLRSQGVHSVKSAINGASFTNYGAVEPLQID